jgi:hypothetical protein
VSLAKGNENISNTKNRDSRKWRGREKIWRNQIAKNRKIKITNSLEVL